MGNELNKTQSSLQEALSSWLRLGEPNAFVTYTFKDAVSYDGATKIFGTHAHALKCHFFGKNSKRRLPMVPVVEKYHAGSSYGALEVKQVGLHIHCLIRFPTQPKDYMETVREAWLDADLACGDPLIYCPDSDDWFLELDTSEKANRLIDYALKTCTNHTDSVLWKFVSLGQ